MIISKRALQRRKVLRGLGAAIALPVLDAMVPALATAAQTKRLMPRRLGFVYIPMGANSAEWMPREDGRLTQLSPSLSALTPVMKRVVVVSNLEMKNAYAPANHATSNSTFLSGVLAKTTEGSDYQLGTTIDQIAARQLGTDTALPSLELATDVNYVVGNCDNGLNCVYMNTLSWATPTTPLPTEANPRVVFERLFGDGGTVADRQAELRVNRSILDWVMDDMKRLQNTVGPSDRTRVDEYVETIREVERRIQRAEHEDDTLLPDLVRPRGMPSDWGEHCTLMFDLQRLALQADRTRVITFQLAREVSTRTYPQIGITEAHHPISHHMDNPIQLAKLAKINQYHVSLFSTFIAQLSATPDGDGSLLDHTMYLLGSGMGNPNLHDHVNLPIVVAGGLDGGRHVRYPAPTPLTNLLLSMLDYAGVPCDRFGDSTGRVDELRAAPV